MFYDVDFPGKKALASAGHIAPTCVSTSPGSTARHNQGKNSQASIASGPYQGCVVRPNHKIDPMEQLPTSVLHQTGSSASASTLMSDLIELIGEPSQRSSSLRNYLHESSSASAL
jgi:hypothetical protein